MADAATMTKRIGDLTGQAIADGRYTQLRRLGEGSMGAVFRARDANLQTDVVIKVPTLTTIEDPEFLERFRREVRYLTKLAHPHIVNIIDVGQTEGVPFIVMPFLSGGSLADRIELSEGPGGLPYESLREWLLEIAKALDFMHGLNCVHRDVKPANILFDQYGNPFLSDFGLVKILAAREREQAVSSLTGAGMVVGTPNYIAPEVVMGGEYDGRADQYSLAMSVYEALTGKCPLEGPTPSATMVNQTTVVPSLLEEVVPDVPLHVAVAVARALEKKPEQRFKSCLAFAQAALGGRGMRHAQAASSAKLKTAAATGDGTRDSRRSGQTQPGSVVARQQTISHGEPGRVPCPVCKKVIPLKPNYAGQRGRCLKCRSYLEIAADLASLKLVPEPSRETLKSTSVKNSTARTPKPGRASPPPKVLQSKSRKRAAPAADADVLVLGETAFGWRLSKGVQLVLGGMFLASLIAAAIYMGRISNAPTQDELLQQSVKRAAPGLEEDD